MTKRSGYYVNVNRGPYNGSLGILYLDNEKVTVEENGHKLLSPHGINYVHWVSITHDQERIMESEKDEHAKHSLELNRMFDLAMRSGFIDDSSDDEWGNYMSISFNPLSDEEVNEVDL